MSDLVTRLRFKDEDYFDGPTIVETMDEAADEIERMRTWIVRLEDAIGAAEREREQARELLADTQASLREHMALVREAWTERDEAQAEVERLRGIIQRADLWKHAPCVLCGYDGPGYHQPETHACARPVKERNEARELLRECREAIAPNLLVPPMTKEKVLDLLTRLDKAIGSG